MIGHNKIIKWVDFLEKDKKKKKKNEYVNGVHRVKERVLTRASLMHARKN